MASPILPDDLESPPANSMNDPFVTAPTPAGAPLGAHHRFSHFDSSQLFALGPNASPAQAKRALEAHLADTDRRMEEAGKLGTALVQQRKELEDRLKDVEKMHSEGELSEDLRHKLVEIEKDYNDVARESARAFLPKQRVPSNEVANPGSPFALEGNSKSGRRSVSPSKFEAQATGSPTKLSVPNRKIRNQPNNRVHDIEFAAEISTSLISQVRNLQALLAEKEEELREVKVERSKLEYEAEGFHQRVRSLDESEHRYKDENWNLETQLHELMAAQKDALDREKKLAQSLSILQTEKNAVQRELDESKLSLSKLSEDHAATVKQHDIDLGTAKRSIVMADSERASMQRKIEDLIGQNQELAKGYSSQRSRNVEREPLQGFSDEDFDTANDNMTPEHSPPPSPVKSTPRHSMLESETLKTSLGHAQRTIQSLRTNYHREKTEKLELRRMLQDARDEIEKVRQDPLAASNRRNSKKVDSKEFKKPPRLLGGLRSARSEIFAEDAEWEDQSDAGAPVHHSLPTRAGKVETDASDQFDTANETSDAAFETANERETETDDFHTGAEDMSSDEGAQTETESPSKRRSILGRSAIFSNNHMRSPSLHSTASTEDEDYPFEPEKMTPTSLPPLQPRFPLRVSRGAFRRSRQASEEPPLQSSPISFTAGSVVGTPQQPGQSLAAELGDFDGSDIESQMSATPSRRSIRGRTASPQPAVPALPRAIMVDSGVMTEPLPGLVPGLSPASAFGIAGAERPVSMNTVLSSRLSTSTYSDAGTVDMQENLAKFPSPPTLAPKREELALSNVHEEMVEPRSETDTHGAELAALRAAHLRETESLQAEHAAGLAGALDRLRSEHAEQMGRVDLERTAAQTAALEGLRADHAGETAQLRTELQNAHAAALDTLQGTHTEELERCQAEMKSAHAQELEHLLLKNAEDSNSAAAEARQAHDKELDALKEAHASAVALRVSEMKGTAKAETADLKAKHAEELAAAQKASEEALAAELGLLNASHANQLAEAKNMLAASHTAEMEGVKSSMIATHTSEVEDVKKSLATAHADELEKTTRKLSATHATELESNKNTLIATHTAQLEETKSHLALAHANELEQAKSNLGSAHARELEETKKALAMAHSKELEDLEARLSQDADKARADDNAAHAEEMNALKDAHLQEIEALEARLTAAHAQELESQKQKHAESLDHLRKELEARSAAEIAALTAANAKQLDSTRAEAEAVLAGELASLKDAHFAEIKSLNEEHASAHAQELENFKAALAKQVDSSQAEGDAAHTEKIEALNAAHAEIVEAHKRDSEKAQSQALESLRNQHESQVTELRRTMAAAKSTELEEMAATHSNELESLRAANESAKAELLESLATSHSTELHDRQKASDETKEQELSALRSSHADELQKVQSKHEATVAQQLERLGAEHESNRAAAIVALQTELETAHAQQVKNLRQELEAARLTEIEALQKGSTEAAQTGLQERKALEDAHARALDSLQSDHHNALEEARVQERGELESVHAKALVSLQSDHQAALEEARTHERQRLETAHATTLASLQAEHKTALEEARLQERSGLEAAHAIALASLQDQHRTALDHASVNLREEHAKELASAASQRDADQSDAVNALKARHEDELARLRSENDASMAKSTEMLKVEHDQALEALMASHEDSLSRTKELLQSKHSRALEAHEQDSLSQRERLVADHAAELEALRRSLAILPPSLALSSMNAVETQPVESPMRSPKRDAFILPREAEQPQTPVNGRIGKKEKEASPLILEDETRQSPSAVAAQETPESQRPFKEMSTNTDARPVGKQTDQSSQTALTAKSMDQMVQGRQRRSSQGSVIITPPSDDAASMASVIRGRPSQESIGSVVRGKPQRDTGTLSTPEPVPMRRPGSSASVRSAMQNPPPLPANHREAIEAARSHSSTGTRGAMGPPIMPASAYKSPASRPHTPSLHSHASVLGTPTPRAGSRVNMHSPTRLTTRSRRSSVSSFASEIDTRFNIRGDMMEAAGLGPGTDPRMIQAITQTMIGEYLWKYTRKAGRGEMSGNRHRRYFWVHPYTRTLYWSERDPSAAGRSELRAKSVPIEAVRVVTDDNPMPPGLHRKSLVVISPGRTVKFTCTTGQRHETWFNALSYLLLRTGTEQQADAEDMAGHITQEDIDEFNPSTVSRATRGTQPRAPPSLSSYNSRTTRTETPSVDVASMSIPTLTPTHERTTGARSGTLSKLSGYWKASTMTGSFSSRRGRAPINGSAIYQASEVHDSAEDLRQMIEQQDRESDRLENVRACCDGKHDVGTLSHTSKRGRLSNLHSHTHHAHAHAHPGPSTTPTPMGSLRSRV